MSFLYTLATRSSSGIGPAGVAQVLAHIGHPQHAYATIHVAGTNGKGSTSAMLASCLRAAGYSVGLFTSPHLVSINERIRINDEPVAIDILESAADELPALITKTGISLGYVESLTVLAYLLFARAQVDIAIIEVGVGGRYDPSNVITPIASVITPISLDHQKLLGNTLPEIAFQKAGIIKSGVPVISGIQVAAVDEVLQAESKQVHAPYQKVTTQEITLHRNGLYGTVFSYTSYGQECFTTSLAGAYQAGNAATVLATLQAIADIFPISVANIKHGLQDTHWPGRLDILQKDPLIIADGAHNEAGFRALGAFLTEHHLRPHVLVGFKEGKNLSSFVEHIIPHVANCVITKGNFHPQDTATIAAQLPISSICIDEVREAYNYAYSLADTHHPLLICGSLYLLGDIYSLRS